MTKRRRRLFGVRASRCPTMELRPPRNGRRRRPEPTYRHSVPCGLGVEPFRQPAFHVAPSVILRARGKRAMRPIAIRRPAASSASIARNLPGGGRRSVTCPRPSDLLRGKIIGFGLLSLVEPFAQAGLGVAPDVAVTARALQTAFAGRPVKNVRSSRRVNGDCHPKQLERGAIQAFGCPVEVGAGPPSAWRRRAMRVLRRS